MPESAYDCIVIGSGPGGYVAAIRAAQLGMSTAVIEKDAVGGRCLNYACIPAKAVLRVADVLHEIDDADEFGISVPERTVDFSKVSERRAEGRQDPHRRRLRRCSRRTRSTTSRASARSPASGKVSVDETEIEARKAIILATGSVPKPIPGTQFGGRVIGTEGAWALQELPKTLAVVGAGASGAEIASAYGRLGTEVLLFEALDRVLPTEDADISKVAGRAARQAEHEDPHRHADRERPVARRQGHVLLRRPARRGRLPGHRRRPRARRRGARPRGGGRQARRPRPDRGRRRAAHVGQGRLRDRRPRQGPGARAQGLRRGRHRRRGRRRARDAPDRVHRHPARDVLHAERRLLRAHRGAGARAGHGRRGRQGQLRRGRRGHRLRRPHAA